MANLPEFTSHDKSLKFWIDRGTVISSQKRSETEISSSGGGGYINQGSGHISAPTITSKNITKHEFWIKTSGGKERAIQIQGVDIPLREGQEVSVIASGRADSDSGYHVALINHTSQSEHVILGGGELLELLKLDGPKIGTLVWFTLVAVVLGGGCGMSFYRSGGADFYGQRPDNTTAYLIWMVVAAITGFLIFRTVVTLGVRNSVIPQLDGHIKGLMRTVASGGAAT